MPRKGTPQVNVILTDEDDKMLDLLCEREQRSRSNAARLLLAEGLRNAKRDGRIKLPKPAPVPE